MDIEQRHRCCADSEDCGNYYRVFLSVLPSHEPVDKADAKQPNCARELSEDVDNVLAEYIQCNAIDVGGQLWVLPRGRKRERELSL